MNRRESMEYQRGYQDAVREALVILNRNGEAAMIGYLRLAAKRQAPGEIQLDLG